ncbi:MAG: homoserine O-succinyltransferase, partial [Clostridia bacterium]|nr:homoserine O-succinyltransferase [Clostridia bacterium]
RGFDDIFYVPHSRYTTVNRNDVEKISKLRILASSDEAGFDIISKIGGRQFFVMGHAEYDALTLDSEYKRDIKEGIKIEMPKNYYLNDDPKNPPVVNWRSNGSLLFINWLNYFVYQSTPYDIKSIN